MSLLARVVHFSRQSLPETRRPHLVLWCHVSTCIIIAVRSSQCSRDVTIENSIGYNMTENVAEAAPFGTRGDSSAPFLNPPRCCQNRGGKWEMWSDSMSVGGKERRGGTGKRGGWQEIDR